MKARGSMCSRGGAAPDVDSRRNLRLWRFCRLLAFAGLLGCASRSGSTETAPRPAEPWSSLPEGAHQTPPPPPSPQPTPPVTTSTPRHEEHSNETHEHGSPRSSSSPAPDESMAQLEADEREAYERAKPVFAAHCARCHTDSGPKASQSARRHFDMDFYPFGGHHAAEMPRTLRRVLGADGGKPTMPRDDPGAVREVELELVLAWAAAFERVHAAKPSHGPDTHHH